MYYFGYGSNLNLEYLKEHCPSAKFVMKAYLPNYEVQFRFWSKRRNGGISTIISNPGELVHGIIYDVSPKEIEVLQTELAEKQQKYDVLNYEVELSRQTHDAYQQKYKEAMVKQSAEIGKSSIVVVSQAIVPINPVAPNKVLNIAIAMVLGAMISSFGVFAREYWKNSGQANV